MVWTLHLTQRILVPCELRSGKDGMMSTSKWPCIYPLQSHTCRKCSRTGNLDFDLVYGGGIVSRLAAAATKPLLSYPTLCDPVDGSPPGSSVPGILQARILEWVAISFSRGSSQPRGQTHVSWNGRKVLYHWATREAPLPNYNLKNIAANILEQGHIFKNIYLFLAVLGLHRYARSFSSCSE